MGLDYTILYRNGKENIVANALSKREEIDKEGQCHKITAVVLEWMKEVVQSYENTEWVKELLTKLNVQTTNEKGERTPNQIGYPDYKRERLLTMQWPH